VGEAAEIPIIAAETAKGFGVSALVVQKINVRSGPATSFAALAELNPKDVVLITGKDSSGAWMQIEFSSSPDGFGWVALKYLQVDSVDSVPIVEAAPQPAATAQSGEVAVSPVEMATAADDGDSLQVPLATALFSPSGIRALQVHGDVSYPQGDAEDWIQFTSVSKTVMVQLTCSAGTLKVDLWQAGSLENESVVECNQEQLLIVQVNQSYSLHLSETSVNELQFTQYTLGLEAAR